MTKLNYISDILMFPGLFVEFSKAQQKERGLLVRLQTIRF